MIMKKIQTINNTLCPCGKKHEFNSEIIVGPNAILSITALIKKYNSKHPYIISDTNTYIAAGRRVCKQLDKSKISYTSFSFNQTSVEPDETTIGTAFMHMKHSCDMIIAVGSGVINDTAKILALHTKLPYIIVSTAPSMDGYASMTSSVTLDGVKCSIPSRCADVIIGDTEILAKCPKKMLLAGIGDMLAKYISICEWRIATLVCNEYYCEEIATLVRYALKVVIENSDAIMQGDTDAVENVFNALNASSIAMNYAGLSRPASGIEHYISHIIDMRGVEFDTPVELHGLQCAIGTLISLKLYEKLKNTVPNKEEALKYVDNFNPKEWEENLHSLLGKSSDAMLLLEKQERKYDKAKHSARLDIILEKWDEIINIINEELPHSEDIEALMLKLGMPTDIAEIGIDENLLPDIFCATKDIRDKYVLSRLLWDLGIIDEFAENLKNTQKTK